MNTITTPLTKISKIFICIIIWYCLLFTLLDLINWSNTHHYKPTDIPDKNFKVVIIDNHKQRSVVNWQVASKQPLSSIVQDDTNSEYAEDFLKKDNDGSLVYHNDGALWYSKSQYSIKQGRLIPISFVIFSAFHAVIGMILATMIFMIGKYFINIWILRHRYEEKRAYKRQVAIKIKKYAIVITSVILFYLVILSINRLLYIR